MVSYWFVPINTSSFVQILLQNTHKAWLLQEELFILHKYLVDKIHVPPNLYSQWNHSLRFTIKFWNVRLNSTIMILLLHHNKWRWCYGWWYYCHCVNNRSTSSSVEWIEVEVLPIGRFVKFFNKSFILSPKKIWPQVSKTFTNLSTAFLITM